MRSEVRQHGALAERAGRQHGVVSHGQMLDLGYSHGAIERALAAGRIHRVHRGVYAVGHANLSRHGHCMAAVLACGEGAVASHGSAAWLLGLSTRFATPPHVTTSRRGHARPTIHLHHSTILEETDISSALNVPTTAVPRTLLDQAGLSTRKNIERLLERAERLNLIEIDALDSIVARSGRHPGRQRLRVAVEIFRDPAMTRARTERLFIALVKRAGLPRPAINSFVAGYEIDAYWERERFGVEIDGYETHRTRAAFERDPVRIEELKLQGIDVIRITARRIEREPGAVGVRLGKLLLQRRRQLA